jgi:hypothetical protein
VIQRLKNNQIDKTRWDQVVTQSDHPLVYLLSWYLDVVSPGWEGLIADDYRAVMPLPVKCRWRIPYLVQPPFCQQLGVTGTGLQSDLTRSFYRKMGWQFPWYNLQIREASGLESRKFLNRRINYTLDLISLYPVLINGYHQNTLRNLKKAVEAGLIAEDCTLDDFLDFSATWLQQSAPRHTEVFACLVRECVQHKVATLLKVKDHEGNILAAACFLAWNRQIVYLAGGSSDEGKRLSAMFRIIDQIIRDYSGTGYRLDFEGSMIPGVARFFRGFGAKASYYYHVKRFLFFNI